MDYSSPIDPLPPAWKAASIGAIASLPVVAVLNWLPDWIGSAGVGGGIMIIGALIAGFVGTAYESTPEAAGLRTGLIGGLAGTAVAAASAGTAATWSPSSVAFVVASGLVIGVAPIFGFVFGHVGGWVANSVDWQSEVDPETSA